MSELVVKKTENSKTTKKKGFSAIGKVRQGVLHFWDEEESEAVDVKEESETKKK